jgi:hypothetical protein
VNYGGVEAPAERKRRETVESAPKVYMDGIPTCSKASHQGSSETHVLSRDGWFEAGCSEGTGCDIELRNMYSCGHWIIIPECWDEKADGLNARGRQQSRPAIEASSQDTTGV